MWIFGVILFKDTPLFMPIEPNDNKRQVEKCKKLMIFKAIVLLNKTIRQNRPRSICGLFPSVFSQLLWPIFFPQLSSTQPNSTRVYNERLRQFKHCPRTYEKGSALLELLQEMQLQAPPNYIKILAQLVCNNLLFETLLLLLSINQRPGRVKRPCALFHKTALLTLASSSSAEYLNLPTKTNVRTTVVGTQRSSTEGSSCWVLPTGRVCAFKILERVLKTS
ncbi:hypothetical protein Pelo_7437 [Pelomyxa schiedti]|nr:hypothetical protein Pelo_7437 [Pelomyxa schiedti]